MAKKGVGRPTIVQENAIRTRLQKFLPDIYRFYAETLKDGSKVLKQQVSKEILGKLIGDVKVQELRGTDGVRLGVVILPPLNDDSDDKAHKGDKESK